jgi:branched-chain amino acid transport system ATP-binding protein/neutral amino acid transport system ATP-binding protein
MGLLSALDLVAGYGPADEILKGVSLDVEPAEIVAIIGPNGAGKSTLLKVLAGLLTLHRGQVTLDGRPIHGRPAREVSALGVAFVPQEQNVFPTMTVRDNLEIGGYRDASARASRPSSSASRPSGRSAVTPRARCRAASARSWRWPWP